MINKKIASELAVGLVMLIALAVGGIFWMEGKDLSSQNSTSDLSSTEQETTRLKALIDKDLMAQKSAQEEREKKSEEWLQNICDNQIKQCDDGWQVTKTVSNCEFVQCPNIYDKTKWKTYRNKELGFEFQYPFGWQIKSISPSDMGGTWFSIAPIVGETRGLRYDLAIFNLDGEFENNPKEWFKARNADENLGRKERNFEINDLNFYLIDEIKDSYIDKNYIVNKDNLLLYFSFRVKDMSSPVIENQYSLFEYESQYETMVDSVKFIK